MPEIYQHFDHRRSREGEACTVLTLVLLGGADVAHGHTPIDSDLVCGATAAGARVGLHISPLLCVDSSEHGQGGGEGADHVGLHGCFGRLRMGGWVVCFLDVG